jgi:uncharacterized protein (TIGR02270 family)
MAAVILSIVEQHAEEAAFLWLLRDRAVHAPHYSLKDLAKIDNRVEAHIDGILIASDEGWELCKGALKQEEVGELFLASVLAFDSGDETRIQTVLEVGSIEPELSRGIVSSLGWLPYAQAEAHIRKLLDAESYELQRVGIAASAIHRQDPGRPVADALANDDALLKTCALKAVGELGRKDLLPTVLEHLFAEDQECRFYAAWSAAVLGSSAGVPGLCDVAKAGRPYSERACSMAFRRMDLPDGHSWVRELAGDPARQRLAVTGAGALGDLASIPWLIENMVVPKLARVAGESFTMITGVDIAYEDLEGEWPEGFEAGPTENPEDEDVALDPDEDLPWPNPELIDQWWSKNKSRFRSGTRYLLGKPISVEQCQHVLRYGYQRQRTAAAIELAMLQPGQPLFEVRAPGFRQQQMLGLKTRKT